MRLLRLTLAAYGQCRDIGMDIGENVTVVLGENEAGKSTALDALSDLLWGIPRNTTRVSEFTRPQLRIDAVLEVDGTPRTVVRKSTGLVTEDLATEIPPPWDPENRLTAQWWQTRLGINHANLRRGGHAVFTGNGDIADVIFAAREGHSAREVLNGIAQEADKIFKQHRGNKSVQLRVAVKHYQQAVADRDARLTRAGDVVEQRKLVESLESKRRRAKETVTATSRCFKQVEENQRVIESVLELRQARSELEIIDGEGDRLSVSDLTHHADATTALQDAEGRLAELETEIAGRSRDIDALSVDDGLLDDKATLDRLQSDAKARVEDLHRADEEFGPDAAKETALLQELLGSIGIETADDVDAALDGARVRTDHAATLNDLADRIEDLEGKRRDAKAARDEALEELAAKGIAVEITESTTPSEEAISKVRQALDIAHTEEATAKRLLSKAKEATNNLRTIAPTPHTEAALTHTDVLDARRGRDTQWATIRRSWVAGDLPVAANRVDMAAELDKRLDGADKVADDEAAQRSLAAAQGARIEAHVEGLEAARREEQSAEEKLGEAAEHYRRLEREWEGVWADLGVAHVPSVDSGSVVAGLLITMHTAHGRDLSAAKELAEISGSWSAAAEFVGLPAACTTAAWRKQAEVLEKVEAIQARRVEAQERETQARRKWDKFVAEAVELLRRHDVRDEGQPVTPAVIEQSLEKLTRQLDAATTAAAKRATYLEQIDEMRAEHGGVQQARQDAMDSLQRLAETHSVDAGQDLEALAERALRASEPIEHEEESEKAIKNGLSPGSNLLDVIKRLEGHDEVTVERAVEEAQVRDEEARKTADHILSEYTSAHDRLAELEEAAGAADAEAEVASRQAEVARLTETWSILALQRKLLEDVLDDLGADDTRPLLDHAGKILEQLTDGRWLALRAEDDGSLRKLLVIRSDAARFGTPELSEGTRDQVFFALRLAAVAELHTERIESGEQALPLVLDDVLMAFDEVRAKSALKILESLAPGLQVIVFTHHQHVAEAASEFDQIKVSCLPAAAPIADALDAELLRAQAQRGTMLTTVDP